MSSRERWTVYPLLFLTLGIALKDKVTKEVVTGQIDAKQVAVDRLRCKSLWVTDREGKPQLVLGHADPWLGLMFVDATGKIFPVRGSSILMPAPQPDAAKKSAEGGEQGQRDALRPDASDSDPQAAPEQPTEPAADIEK